jgi:hypothetical protein
VPYFKGIKGVDWGKHVERLCKDNDRNEMIADFAHKIINANHKDSPIYNSSVAQCMRYLTKNGTTNGGHNKIIAITGNVKDHLEHLPKYLDKYKITHDYLSAKKKKYNDCYMLMGTSLALGIGFDQKTGCKNFDGIRGNVVMQLVTAATPELCEQIIGRACRADVAIGVVMVDRNRISERHWNKGMLPFLNELNDVEIVTYKGDPRTENKQVETRTEPEEYSYSDDSSENYDMDSSE